jgi:hypothetical protein
LEIVDVSDTTMAATGTNKKITAGQVLASGLPGSFSTLAASGTATFSGNITKTSALTAAYAMNANISGYANAYTVYMDGTSLRIGNEVALPVDIQSNASTVGRFSSTGLAVTGALSATTLAASGGAIFQGPLNVFHNAVNTYSDVVNGRSIQIGGYAGITESETNGEMSIGSNFAMSSSAARAYKYLSVGGASRLLSAFGSTKIDYAISGSAGGVISWATVGEFSSTGLAVTGAVSATTTGKVGTTLGVGNATPSASGAGITFPATQSASTDPNTLDDYEEGTWTPSQGAGLTVVGAFSSSGTYTKKGNEVTVYGKIASATSVAFAANVAISGALPFAATVTGSPIFAGVGANSTNTASAVCGVYSTAVYSSGALAATTHYEFVVTYFV